MPLPYTSGNPDGYQVQLRLTDEQVTLTRFTSYSFESDFLSPSDGFTFTIEDESLPQAQSDALVTGARVSLTINSLLVADGFIDSIAIGADKGSGRSWQVKGRDRLSLAVDSGADPTIKYPEGATLADVLVGTFSAFGWVNPDTHFSIDNSANRAVSTGGDRGIKMTKGGKKKGPQPLKSFVCHQSKPYMHESCFEFATRLSKRFGLWIWCSADGEVLQVGQPDFDQDPLYQLRRGTNGVGNIESGTVTYDHSNQPSMIIADSFGGGGEYGKGRFKAFCVNPYFGVDNDGFVLPEVQAIVSKLTDSEQVVMTTQPYRRRNSVIAPRPVYLHDDESKSQDQINAYVRREMSLLLRQSIVAEYTVTGHGQYDANGNFTAWAIDTVVDVQDDVGDLHERMYVLGLSFEQSRRGTFTKLHLIRLNSIQF